MIRHLTIATVFAACRLAAATPCDFGTWPKDLDPKSVGARVVAQFQSTEPEAYAAKGFDAGSAYGGGKYVCYSVASLWVNALEYARVTGDAELEKDLCGRFSPFLPGGAKSGKVTKFRHVDFNVFGSVPLEVALLTSNSRALDLGLRYADDQWEEPRADDTAEMPEWMLPHYVPPEKQRDYLKAGLSGQTRLWIDDMYMINLLQTQAYRATRDRAYVLRAAKEMRFYLEKLQLENGLFNHAEGVPFRWGRGNGWMAAGMPLVLQYLKPTDADYAAILAGYRKMMATLLACQRPSGLWGQLVDDPESWEETSGSLMFAYGFIMGCKYGWLDAKVYAPAARRAYLAVASSLDQYGNVPNVCCGTGAENSRKYYYERRKINGDPHGQAPLLWCCVALLDFGNFANDWEFPPDGFKMTDRQKKWPPRRMDRRIAQICPVGEGELRLTPTYASCSVVWGALSPLDGLKVEYRKPGGTWKRGEEPVYFADVRNYRSSILSLEENTAYEARLVVAGRILATGAFHTWKSDVPVARTVEIDPATAKYPIVISDKGTPDGWIRYTAKKGTVVGGKDITKTGVIRISRAQYVLLDDLTVEGGAGDYQSAILIADSKGVRVRNCEIRDFGRQGTPVFTESGKGRCVPNAPVNAKNVRGINWDAGIMIYPGSSEVTVERCYIHDARTRSNAWYYAHPSGTEGIFVYRSDGSVVLRWNDIVGSDHRRFNDCIEGCDNFEADGGFNRDSDIYGNFCIFANDDCIEIDGGQQNVRCFDNRFEAAFSDISIQGCMVSPVYVHDNLLAPPCDEFGKANPCIKTYGFDMFWYRPYASVRGNCFGERSYEPALGETSRWNWGPGNFFCTNEVPLKWACDYPVRDLPFVLDRGIVRGVTVSGDEAVPRSVKIRVRATARTPYRICRNHDVDWLSVTPAEGTFETGDNELQVTFDASRMADRRHWRAAFLVRTPQGLSRAVSVYAERTDYEQPSRPVAASVRTQYAAVTAAESFSVPFDVTEEGDYWFCLRGAADVANARIAMSVDGEKERPSILRFEKTYPTWNLLRPGCRQPLADNGFDPYHLKPGRHTLAVKKVSKGPLTVTDAVLTDDPNSFEPR